MINLSKPFTEEEWELFRLNTLDPKDIAPEMVLYLRSTEEIGREVVLNKNSAGDNDQAKWCHGERFVLPEDDFKGIPIQIHPDYPITERTPWAPCKGFQPINISWFSSYDIAITASGFTMGREGWNWPTIWFQPIVQKYSKTPVISLYSLFPNIMR